MQVQILSTSLLDIKMKNSLTKIAFAVVASILLVACGTPTPTAPSSASKTEYEGWTKVAYNFYRYEDKSNNIVCYWHWIKDNISCIKVDGE
jgi:hypothetical protein